MKRLFLVAIAIIYVVAGMQGVVASDQCSSNSVCRNMSGSVGTGDIFNVTLSSDVQTSEMSVDVVMPSSFKVTDWSCSRADDANLTVFDVEYPPWTDFYNGSNFSFSVYYRSLANISTKTYYVELYEPNEIYNITNISHSVVHSIDGYGCTLCGHKVLEFTVTDVQANGFTISYKLKAPETTGNYTITGSYYPLGGSTKMIEGDTSINVVEKCLIYKKPGLDSDNDGWTDVEELKAGTDPFDSKDYPTKDVVSKSLIYEKPGLDSDNDGWTDVKELEAGTDPFDSNDHLTKQDIVDVVTEWVQKYFSVP